MPEENSGYPPWSYKTRSFIIEDFQGFIHSMVSHKVEKHAITGEKILFLQALELNFTGKRTGIRRVKPTVRIRFAVAPDNERRMASYDGTYGDCEYFTVFVPRKNKGQTFIFRNLSVNKGKVTVFCSIGRLGPTIGKRYGWVTNNFIFSN